MIFSLLLLLLHVNASTDIVPITIDEQFTMTTSETAEWKDEKMMVEIISVADSRCPENTNCIWAGELGLKLNIIKDGKESIYDVVVPAIGARNHRSKVVLGENTLHFLGQYTYKKNEVLTTEEIPVLYEFVVTKSDDSTKK